LELDYTRKKVAGAAFFFCLRLGKNQIVGRRKISGGHGLNSDGHRLESASHKKESAGTGSGKSRLENPNGGFRSEICKDSRKFSPITKNKPIFPLDRIFGFLWIYYYKIIKWDGYAPASGSR
jgi:hypothetical protein